MKKTLFISDLHLSENLPEATKLFLYLLESCNTKVEAVYILGDLFEAWIGDDNKTEYNLSIMRAIKALSEKGIKTYFMRGNRDFLIGKRFAKATQCTLLKDPSVISLYGQSILLMHGDTLCTKDVAYQRWRRIATNPWLHVPLFLALPLRWRRWGALQLRNNSKTKKPARNPEIYDVVQYEVEKQMQRHKAFTLIHGHTHKAGVHDFTINHTPAKRIVLGDWHHSGNVLIVSEDGNKELIFFDTNSQLDL